MKKFNFIFLVFFIASCENMPDWLGAAQEPPLVGERIAVMESSINLQPDQALKAEIIDIPPSETSKFETTKSIKIGEPATEGYIIGSVPIIADNKIFVMDGAGNVFALNPELQQLWSYKTNNDPDKLVPSGGATYQFGVLYTTNGLGQVTALAAENGTVLWTRNLGGSIRKAPVVSEDKLFVATNSNQLFALNIVDGSTIWRHAGSGETTTTYGSPIPTVKDETLVIAYSSGEVFALNTQRGSEIWAETISTGTERRKTAATFVDVSAAPIIIEGIVYIGSRNGTLAAYNLSNGNRIWNNKIGDVESTPTVVGKYIFAISDRQNLLAINKLDGRIKWVSKLPLAKDEKIGHAWFGPVLAGNKLISVSSDGILFQVNVIDGNTISKTEIANGVFSSPVLENNTIYIQTKNADLIEVK